MSINDKIKQILLTKGYSPSHFADEIGVQRSSISHILSGRNRPSFDIIQKIIKRFPDLGFDWILEDDAPSSPTYGRNSASSAFVRTEPFKPEASPQESMSNRSSIGSTSRINRSEISSAERPDEYLSVPDSLNAAVNTRRKVERILIFYSDGTFQEYNPS